MSVSLEASAASSCDATIAICTYNRLATLPRTLDSLALLRGPYSFEVIVVNGPSTDGTGDYLATRDDIRVLENREANLAISRNLAIANAAGRFIAFIDDDAVPEPDWLTLVLDRFQDDEDLAAVGGFIRDEAGIGFQDKYVFCDLFGTGYAAENPDYATFLRREKRIYPSLTGTNVVFRAEALRQLQGFDETFAYFLDETDVNKRMDDAGLRMAVVPEAEVHHKFAPSHLRTQARVSLNMYPTARSVAYFAMRHALPELGWSAVSDRLKEFYRKEFFWKRETLAAGRLDRAQFEGLMLQVRQGIIDGIDRAIDQPPGNADGRLARRRAEIQAPLIRQMRAPDGALRLAMLSQDHSHPEKGGIGRWTNLVGRGIAELGHEVTLIGDLGPTAQREYCEFTPEGVWSHNLRPARGEGASEVDCLGLPASLATASVRRLAELRRIQPRRRFDVLSSPIWDVEGAAAIGSGFLPTVLSLHTCAGLMLESKPEWRSREDFFRDHVLKVINAEIQALRRSTLLLANSKAILRDIGEVYGLDLMARPHAVVPHGIDDIEAPEGVIEDRESARAAASATALPPVRILFLGRLETRKGVVPMTDALDLLLSQGLPVAADIVGGKVDAENLARVRRLVEQYPDQVTWHGFLDDEALDPLMRRADIFFAPSLYESFGLIFVEAMRYGLPCVAYDTGGVAEVIEHGTDGLLAPLEDREALATALSELVRNADLRSRMSRAARRSFEQKFHYRLMAERLAEVYRDAAQREAIAG